VTDLPLGVQGKLLRAIESGEVIPVDGTQPIRVDVRALCATQIALGEAVGQQVLRRDLAARVDGVTIHLPPLRQRVAEIPFLFNWLLKKHGGDHAPRPETRLLERLCLHDWPSNVRELEYLVRRLVATSPGSDTLRAVLLPESMGSSGLAPVVHEGSRPTAEGFGARDARDFAQLKRSLRTSRGNVARAAAAIGISRQRAYRLLEAHPETQIEEYRRGRATPGAESNGDD